MDHEIISSDMLTEIARLKSRIKVGYFGRVYVIFLINEYFLVIVELAVKV